MVYEVCLLVPNGDGREKQWQVLSATDLVEAIHRALADMPYGTIACEVRKHSRWTYWKRTLFNR